MIGNRLKLSVKVNIRDSIETIKIIGRQHAFLIEIIEQLNVCYSYQVCYSMNASILHCFIPFQIIFLFSGFQQYGSSIYLCHIYYSFIVSYYIVRNIIDMRSFMLACAVYKCHNIDHLSQQLIEL